MAMPRFGLAIALAIVSVAYVVFVHGPPVRGGYGLPVFYSCPDVLSYIIPAALHCKLCRTAVVSGQVSDCSCDFETVMMCALVGLLLCAAQRLLAVT